MDREGFRNRLKQYKEAKGSDPLLKYWEWKQKYDAAPQPDNMPGQPQPDQPTPVSQPLDNMSHRADNPHTVLGREPFDSPYDDSRYYDYRKPRFELRKGDVHYSNPNLLKWMGRFGKVLRGGSLFGETILNLFPSEEAELLEDLRVKMDKQNKWLTGQEAIPKYDEGGEVKNQLKYKNSKVPYNSNPSTFTKNLYNRIIPIPGTMPEGLILGGIKQYFKNSDGRVKNLFSEKNLGPLDESQFNYIRDEIIKGHQGPIESMEPYILEDTKDLYLGMPQRHNTYEYSDYKPKNAKSKQYYKNKFLEDAASPILINVADDIKLNRTIPKDDWMGYGKAYEITKNKNALAVLPGYGHATVGVGTDPKRGEYVSYYDKWDIGLGTEESKHPLDYIYDPVNIYGRVYLDDYYNVNSAPNKGDYYGGYLPEVKVKPKKYDEGGRVIPTQEEYITQQIAAKKAAALEKSLSRTMPRVPQGIKTGERWNPVTKKVEDILECGPSCAYTFSDNYGLNWMGSEDFKQNHTNYGWKQVPWEQRQPGNAVLIVDDSGTAKHTMMYDSDNAQGQPLFNHSNGGHDESAIRKKAKYPHHNPYLTYEFVGTPADSTQWINDYKKLYGFADGGEVGDNDFMKLFGKQVSYEPEETSWWSNVKNWWNDLTGMKNYAYGNCATTPNGKHTEECAHYSNSVLRNRGYKNIIGDAWTRAANSGMKKITSGYDGLTKPAEWDESDAHDYLQSAANNFINNVDTTALNPYDVIGLYYPDSPNTKKAFEQGRWGETQTHTGHIAVGNDGTHYVVHNVGGHLKMNKLADMLTGDYDYLPVSAYRPKK